jgi:DnaJ-class molecular chaperone
MLATSLRKYTFSVNTYNAGKNYYKILNLGETANQTDIKKAYRQLAKKYHPDTNQGK